MYCDFNGDFLLEEKAAVPIHNRAFRYGDAVFESMRCINGKIPFLVPHCQRLFAALNTLQFEIPLYFDRIFLESRINNLLSINKLQKKDAKIRLSVYRDGAGNYTPTTNALGFLITCEPLAETGFAFNPKGLFLGAYTDFVRPNTPFSAFKNGNSLYYVLAGIYAQKNQFGECVLLNENQHIVECISSSFFMVKNKEIFTPPLHDGAVAGVMRSAIMEICKKNNLTITEKSLKIADMEQADEVFLTNATLGVRWAMGFEKHRFYKTETSKIQKMLNEAAMQ